MNADPTLQSPTQRLGEPALARCFELATKQSNHLHAAASRLSSPRRYEFFLACYAAMRALDDLVDCEFLGHVAEEREKLRPVMLQRLARWEAQVDAAAKGHYTARDDDFEPRRMLPLSLSYDHRLVDGAEAARFLSWLTEAIEQPLRLALEG